MNLTDTAIASQLAVAFGCIAQYDCPHKWPELLPSLLEVIRMEEANIQNRALVILKEVAKALTFKDVTIAGKRKIEMIAKNIYNSLLDSWGNFTEKLLEIRNSHCSNECILYLQNATVILRILSKLTIYGYRTPHSTKGCMQFLESIIERTKESVIIRNHLKLFNSDQHIISLIDKFILKLMKFLNKFSEYHPLSFTTFVISALEISFDCIFNCHMLFDGSSDTFADFDIQSLKLMKNMLSNSTTNFNTPASIGHLEIIAMNAQNRFFSNERLKLICEKLILKYFLLNQSDINLWEQSAEKYICGEGGENWKYALRPCAEKLFITLLHQFKPLITAEIANYIRKAQEVTLTATSNIEELLLKEAIYYIAGISAFNLFDEVDFDLWLASQLTQEIFISTDSFRIIRRRIIWLIGKWSDVKLHRDSRRKSYEICLNLLRQDENMAIRLEASRTLNALLDGFEFESQQFLPYVDASFNILIILLKELKECDLKMGVLYIISNIIRKMSDDVTCIQNLLTYLPVLWIEGKEHNMLLCAVISTMNQSIRAISELPGSLGSFLYSIVAVSTNVENNCHVYLIEDGLELWLTVIENSSVICDDLFDLGENLIPVIENSLENLRLILSILEAYVILSPDLFLHRFGSRIIAKCTSIFKISKPEEKSMILKIFVTCLKSNPTVTVELLRLSISHFMREICVVQDCSMNIMYLIIIARVLIFNQAIFASALQDSNVPNVLESLLDIWLTQTELVTNIENRKLFGLALGFLMTVDNPIVFKRLEEITTTLAGCLNYIMREDSEGTLVDVLYIEDETDLMLNENNDYETHHSKRCRIMRLSDPVYRTPLLEYLEHQVNMLRKNIGNQNIAALISKANSLSIIK